MPCATTVGGEEPVVKDVEQVPLRDRSVRDLAYGLIGIPISRNFDCPKTGHLEIYVAGVAASAFAPVPS